MQNSLFNFRHFDTICGHFDIIVTFCSTLVSTLASLWLAKKNLDVGVFIRTYI